MYEQALKTFHRLPAFDRVDPHTLREESFDLSRFQRFLDQIGNPEKGLPVIHIAGSKGKGSTAALIGSGLQALGKRVGVFISPYLQHPTEAIFVDGQAMKSEIFSHFMDRYLPILNRLPNEGYITSFELLTAMALQYFHEVDVDFAVMETGLGGRLDATNIIESPVVSVISAIEKEHTELLGNSLTSIAYEKLGIVREKTPVIIAPQHDPFLADFAKTVAAQKKAPCLSVSGRYESYIMERSPEAYRFRLKTPSREIGMIPLGLLGDHQVNNGMTAWAVLDYLIPEFDPSPVSQVWQHLSLPGRFEYTTIEEREWILDGAHTAQSAKALRKTLDQIYGGKPMTFVLAFLNDKDVEAVLRELIRWGDSVVVTQVDHPRALPARVVEQRMKHFTHSDQIVFAITNNLFIAQQKAHKMSLNNPICATGSFKLVEALRGNRA